MRYNTDGSINFIGRNDGQVKVRGQRIELGEIEHQLAAIESDVAHCVVSLPKRGLCADRLVAMVSFHTPYPEEDGGTVSDGIRLLDPAPIAVVLEGLKNQIKEKVPTYMVPRIWLPVKAVPLTAACKINRRGVTDWIEQLSQAILDKVLHVTSQTVSSAASGSVESRIAVAWGKALHIAPNNIPVDRSFFSVGGDSVLAMDVINQCRRQGIEISARNILRGHTIADLSRAASPGPELSAFWKARYKGPAKP